MNNIPKRVSIIGSLLLAVAIFGTRLFGMDFQFQFFLHHWVQNMILTAVILTLLGRLSGPSAFNIALSYIGDIGGAVVYIAVCVVGLVALLSFFTHHAAVTDACFALMVIFTAISKVMATRMDYVNETTRRAFSQT